MNTCMSSLAFIGIHSMELKGYLPPLPDFTLNERLQNPFDGVERAMVVEVGESEFIEFIWCS
jgi:hypothetical protein